MTFGDEWTRVLVIGANQLGVPPEWILAVIALESGFNPLAKSIANARGLWQKMPSKDGKPYAETDPTKQLQDAFAFWVEMKRVFVVPAFTSREAFYCLNLAPARLMGGTYTDETVLYSKAKHKAAYEANRGLDVTKRGDIRIKDLRVGLDASVRRCQGRYDDELAAARDSHESSPTDMGPVGTA